MSEGYNHNFDAWDKAINDRFGDKLNNLPVLSHGRKRTVFKSPKGIWMMVSNTSYTDIKIVSLEDDKVVFDGGLYMGPNKNDYFHHASHSDYVPAFQKYHRELRDTFDMYLPVYMYDINKDKQSKVDLDNVICAPLLFHSWTLWAADYEFFVSLFDLSQIDDGIIKEYNTKGIIGAIPREADHVRNYVKLETLANYDSSKQINFPTDFDFRLLEENQTYFSASFKQGLSGDKAIPLSDDPPWLASNKRMREEENKRIEAEMDNARAASNFRLIPANRKEGDAL